MFVLSVIVVLRTSIFSTSVSANYLSSSQRRKTKSTLKLNEGVLLVCLLGARTLVPNSHKLDFF